MHVNVKQKKTLAIARYTCYGKYREDVYNTRILKSYVDELLEYVESWSFKLNVGILSLIFWRGQVRVWKFHLPLHSLVAFISATYVIERPHLIPAYFFFCIAWCMLILMCHQNRHPSPWHRTKSFAHHLGRHTFSGSFGKAEGETIHAKQGFEETKEMHEARKKIMEENKMLKSQIAAVRRELKKLLSAVSDVHIKTCEDGSALNPLGKLLPVQLILRDIIYYVRWFKMTLDGKNSQLSFLIIICSSAIGLILTVLPVMTIISLACKLSIWIFLGPWMKLVDLAYQRRRPDGKVEKHVKKVMEDIQEREKKRWIRKRIKREEAVKLRATRIIRFGPFAIKVPSANITRFHDYPLPSSTANPIAGCSSDNIAVDISQHVPGQKHSGVMIPELSETVKKTKTNRREKKRDAMVKLKSIVDEEKLVIKNESHNSGIDKADFQQEIMPNLRRERSDSLNHYSNLNQTTEEGIELVANENKIIRGERIQICCSNGNKIGAFLSEERDQFCSRDGELLDKRELDQSENN